jgi:hypothetical protein
LVVTAKAEAARLVAAAQDLALEGNQRYDTAYSAATAAGWTAADLTALGLQPTGTSPRRRRTALPAPPDAVDSAVAVPAQPIDQHDQQPVTSAH